MEIEFLLWFPEDLSLAMVLIVRYSSIDLRQHYGNLLRSYFPALRHCKVAFVSGSS
jgi:hypothetical protein